MKEQLAQIKERALEGLAACTTMRELEDLRVQVLGKKGELTGILKQMGKLSPEERPVIGQLANEVRQDLEQKLDEYKAALREKQQLIDVMKYSLIIISSIPVLLLYPFIQKYFVKGVMIGSLKG